VLWEMHGGTWKEGRNGKMTIARYSYDSSQGDQLEKDTGRT
jgi:hypothetical protein